jgi:hypothetical protein
MNENTTMFGDLTLGWEKFYWAGTIEDLGPFGKEIELHVDTKDGEKIPPHPLQVAVWQRIFSDPSRYLHLIRESLFQYYCCIRPQYERAGPDWITNMPVLTKAEDLDDLVTLSYISIRWPYDGNAPEVGFSFHCEWDREHGAGVVLRDETAIDVGGADCVCL